MGFKEILSGVVLMFLLTCDGIFANIALAKRLKRERLDKQKNYFYKNYRNMDLESQNSYLEKIGCKFKNHQLMFCYDTDKKIERIVKGG